MLALESDFPEAAAADVCQSPGRAGEMQYYRITDKGKWSTRLRFAAE